MTGNASKQRRVSIGDAEFSNDDELLLWNINTQHLVGTLPIKDIDLIRISPDGRNIAGLNRGYPVVTLWGVP